MFCWWAGPKSGTTRLPRIPVEVMPIFIFRLTRYSDRLWKPGVG